MGRSSIVQEYQCTIFLANYLWYILICKTGSALAHGLSQETKR